MATTITIKSSITSVEVLDAADYPGASQPSDRTIRSSGESISEVLGDSSTPAVEKTGLIIVLTIGPSAEVIDLSSADIGLDRTEDMTGKRLVAYEFVASSSNAGSVTVKADTTNGYDLFGASCQHILVPGEGFHGAITGVASAKDAVSASDLRINIAGTEDDVVSIGMWFGT